MKILKLICLFFIFALAACSETSSPIDVKITELPTAQIRGMQVRHFSQNNQDIAMQSVIKTLASLDFQVNRVDDKIGLIEAIQLDHGSITQLNCLVHSDGKGSSIRINARYNEQPILTPEVYQRFFESLSKNLS